MEKKSGIVDFDLSGSTRSHPFPPLPPPLPGEDDPVPKPKPKPKPSPGTDQPNPGGQPDDGQIPSTISRKDFPKGFLFGTLSSAYQTEGAARKGGRGPSIWDSFTLNTPANIQDGSNGNVAADSYHNFKDDVRIMKRLGFTAYRFSISWSRVLPGGDINDGVNKEGIQYYNDLINELLANGIEPIVTLFNWDLPQMIQGYYGGFRSRKIVKDFCNYAKLCFLEFGDRVKIWITLNDPWSFCVGGYVTGTFPPGQGDSSLDSRKDYVLPSRCSPWKDKNQVNGNPGTDPYWVAHHLIIAHSQVVALYREEFQAQEGKIGISLWSPALKPRSNTNSDIQATNRAFDFIIGWFLSPLTNGEYPESMKKRVGGRLPQFSIEEYTEMVKGSYDFVGLNYNTASFVADAPDFHTDSPSYLLDAKVLYKNVDAKGTSIGQKTGSNWQYSYSAGIRDVIKKITTDFKVQSIYITENGFSEKDNPKITVTESRVDIDRIQYHFEHLAWISKANNIYRNVKGYFACSFLDNFEWVDGYTIRYGTVHTDFKSQLERTPKYSALWFKDFLGGKLMKVPEARPLEKYDEDEEFQARRK